MLFQGLAGTAGACILDTGVSGRFISQGCVGLHHWMCAVPTHMRCTVMGSIERAVAIDCNCFSCTSCICRP